MRTDLRPSPIQKTLSRFVAVTICKALLISAPTSVFEHTYYRFSCSMWNPGAAAVVRRLTEDWSRGLRDVSQLSAQPGQYFGGLATKRFSGGTSPWDQICTATNGTSIIGPRLITGTAAAERSEVAILKKGRVRYQRRTPYCMASVVNITDKAISAIAKAIITADTPTVVAKRGRQLDKCQDPALLFTSSSPS
ncbi:hypothetical protein BU16DRAFT_555920 [Lophium mytilinum]|uniref:Uncharacterized protein n=1 Tax=Lophium mytilinum TaxID=390894 RepID=A0A6A6RDC6_9PEZI|nr:hypothetical protein BU16DRAFT_555920 [Lophium mytilinum]